MKRAWVYGLVIGWFLLQASQLLFSQAHNRPFVKNYHSGYENFFYFNSLWPQGDGWWGHWNTLDTMGSSYYYGAEVVLLDSFFEISNSVRLGDTSKYYLEYPIHSPKTMPDGQGNYWYWQSSYIAGSPLSRHQFFGKLDASGQIVFEREIANASIYDSFNEFVHLPNGNGLLVFSHRGQFTYLTWLIWIDSLGNVLLHDSTEALHPSYFHATIGCKVEHERGRLVAPSFDFLQGAYQNHTFKPRIFTYDLQGTLLSEKDLTSQLFGNAIYSIFPLPDGSYAAGIVEYIPDSIETNFETHRPGIAKLDSNFDVVFTRYIFPDKINNGGTLHHDSISGCFYMAGRHDSYPSDSFWDLDWYITKFSPNLDSVWTRIYDIGGDSLPRINQDPVQMHFLDNGDLLVLVQNSGYGKTYSTLYRLDSMGCLISGCGIGDTVVIPPDTGHYQPPPRPPDIEPMGQLLAFPNPSNGLWSLVWDVYPGDKGLLELTDIQGRPLLQREIVRSEWPSQLDLSTWAQGVYLLKITSEKGRIFRARLILVR